MDTTIGTQLTLNQKPAVVVAVTPFQHCEVVVLFWPGTQAPPVIEGRTRPGPWGKKTVTLLRFPDGAWYWDYDHRAHVAENLNPRMHIPLESWMAAFAQSIHPPVLR